MPFAFIDQYSLEPSPCSADPEAEYQQNVAVNAGRIENYWITDQANDGVACSMGSAAGKSDVRTAQGGIPYLGG